jgi:predicted nuclease with TOPRIM domain
VAKEAGSDPSALKKSRFPSLIAEIKTYVEQHAEKRPPSLNQVNHLARQKSRALRDRIEQVARQRDQLASLLSEADAKIIELYDRIAELERQLPASNILSLDPRGPESFEITARVQLVAWCRRLPIPTTLLLNLDAASRKRRALC